jgi:hypothetical protein
MGPAQRRAKDEEEGGPGEQTRGAQGSLALWHERHGWGVVRHASSGGRHGHDARTVR